jgi:transporter family protein
MAILGADVGSLCCADGHFREGRRRERQCRFATFIRTIVILLTLAFILLATGQFQSFGSISGRSYLFLVLSGLATGGSWICYFRALKIGQAAQVAPIDKLSVVLVALFGVVFLGEKLTMPNWLGVALIATGEVLVAYR